MTDDPDPRIQRLAGEAAYAAEEYDPKQCIGVRTNKQRLTVEIKIVGTVETKTHVCDVEAVARLPIERLDELLGDLLAARASLVKLMGGTRT